MKLINALYLSITLLVAGISWKFLEPILAKNGTAVISASVDNKNGGNPITVKLPPDLTKKQYEMLNFAYEVAKADGFKEPKYLQGIIMQESKAGSMNSFRVAGLSNAVGNRYFGIGQIKLQAAKAVMQRYPEMWNFLDTKTDEELQAKLILDDKYNIMIASKYLLLLGINRNPELAILSYNRGAAGALNLSPLSSKYVINVKRYSEKFVSISTRV